MRHQHTSSGNGTIGLGNKEQKSRWQLAKEKLSGWVPKQKSGNYDFGFGFFLILWMKKKIEEEKKIHIFINLLEPI